VGGSRELVPHLGRTPPWSQAVCGRNRITKMIVSDETRRGAVATGSKRLQAGQAFASEVIDSAPKATRQLNGARDFPFIASKPMGDEAVPKQ